MWPMIIFPLYVLWSLSRELIECCDMRYSNLYVLWQLADFKITAQRLFDQVRAPLHINSSAPFVPYSLSNMHMPWCHVLLSLSKIFGCTCPCIFRFKRWTCVTFLSVFSPQTSMSVRPLHAWMVGHVWTKWTSSLVSVPKAGLEPPVRAPCQHVGIIHYILRPHTHMLEM